jgi:ABC-type phosphate/phosphonate transport system ATPase subunit
MARPRRKFRFPNGKNVPPWETILEFEGISPSLRHFDAIINLDELIKVVCKGTAGKAAKLRFLNRLLKKKGDDIAGSLERRLKKQTTCLAHR